MAEVFPDPSRRLPHADIPVPGLQAYLSRGPDHQVIFMACGEEVDVPLRVHTSQWRVALAGRTDLEVDGVRLTYSRDDHALAPTGVLRPATIYAGYADINVFDQSDRYSAG